jgi:hypothetical protein
LAASFTPVQVSAEAGRTESLTRVEIVEAILTDPTLNPCEFRHLVG